MSHPREHLEDWLRDAYAMERQAQTLLESQLNRLENYPLLQDRIRLHLDQTLNHLALVESCLRRLGTAPSTIKDLAARVAAYGQVAGSVLASDEAVKSAMAGYVFEHVEIAAYTTLISAADALGEYEIRECCERILGEEEAMASWLLRHIPELTAAFLERSAVQRDDAKR